MAATQSCRHQGNGSLLHGEAEERFDQVRGLKVSEAIRTARTCRLNVKLLKDLNGKGEILAIEESDSLLRFSFSSGAVLTAYRRRFVSTNCIAIVDLIAREPVARAERVDGREDFILQVLAALEVTLFLCQADQEVADESTHGLIALGCLDAYTAIEFIGQ